MNNIKKGIGYFFAGISLLAILIFLFWGGHYLWFCGTGHPVQEVVITVINSTDSLTITSNSEQIDKLIKNINEFEKNHDNRSNKIQKKISEEYLTVSSLNGFYASLFTAIAVIVALIAAITWKNFSDYKKTIEEVVDKKIGKILHRQELIKWVKGKIENNDGDNSTLLNLNEKSDDKKNIESIKKMLLNEFTDNSWLEIILAKCFVDKHEFKKANKIYKFIEARDLLDTKSNIEPMLYHMIGQLYSQYYFARWTHFKKCMMNKEDSLEIGDIIKNFNEKPIEEYPLIEDQTEPLVYLTKSKEYFEKSLSKAIDISKNNDKHNALSNLATINIEIAKLSNTIGIQKTEEYIKEIIELGRATFNTYYDLARVKFLINNDDIKSVKENLYIASSLADNDKKRSTFIRYINEEDILYKIDEWELIKSELIKNKK